LNLPGLKHNLNNQSRKIILAVAILLCFLMEVWDCHGL
jgi:hypothetical protein